MYTCTSCHTSLPKWSGQCPNCGQWNTLEESLKESSSSKRIKSSGNKKDVRQLRPRAHSDTRIPVKSNELSTVLGGGIVPGSLLLLSGEPGIGKSTLTLQIADWVGVGAHKVLYVS